jgi:transposase
MNKRTRRTFTKEFKLESAQLVLDQGYSIGDAAKSLGLSGSTLRGWVQQVEEERNGVTPKGSALTEEQIKIKELEAKVRQLETEKRILKKATALLMSDDWNATRS